MLSPVDRRPSLSPVSSPPGYTRCPAVIDRADGIHRRRRVLSTVTVGDLEDTIDPSIRELEA
jgi:hypothetical protein